MTRTRRAAAIVGIGVLGLAIATACGALGWWQWTRSHVKAEIVAPDPVVPIADVLAPASSAGAAIGRRVSVAGTWADVDAVLVTGREVDGTPAVVLVRALIVDADLTGTGESATLPVVVGWRPAADATVPDDVGHVALTGYFRAPEEARPAPDPAPAPPGTRWSTTISPSELAQFWPAPMYSAPLASFEGSASWAALPPPPPQRDLDFRSLAYALEWWAFGGFALFVAARLMRDNGRTSARKEIT